MKNAVIPALLAAVISVHPAHASGLLGGTGISASVDIAGISADADVGIGGGSGITASADVDLGRTYAVSADVGVLSGGSLANVDLDVLSYGPDGKPLSKGDKAKRDKARFDGLAARLIGQPLVSSDNVVLGQILDLRASGGACPTFAIRPDKRMDTDHSKVWVKSNSCEMGPALVRVSLSSQTFAKQTRN